MAKQKGPFPPLSGAARFLARLATPFKALTAEAGRAILKRMDAFHACMELNVIRQDVPDELAFFRDRNTRRTIAVPGIGKHVSIDFWAPIMAAHLEAEGRLDSCESERDLLVTLVECLLETDFKHLSNCPHLAKRSLELAIDMARLVYVLRRCRGDGN